LLEFTRKYLLLIDGRLGGGTGQHVGDVSSTLLMWYKVMLRLHLNTRHRGYWLLVSSRCQHVWVGRGGGRDTVASRSREHLTRTSGHHYQVVASWTVARLDRLASSSGLVLGRLVVTAVASVVHLGEAR